MPTTLEAGLRQTFAESQRGLRTYGFAFDAYGLTGWRPDSPFARFCDVLHGPTPTLTEVLVRQKYDLVHCIDTAYEAPFFVERWLRRARFRGGVVLSCHNSNTTPLTMTPSAPHVAVAVSEAAAAALRVRVDSVRVIPNAVDVECFRPTDVHYTGKPILLWVGRSDDVQQKDLPGFLRVLRRNPSYRGVIVDADHRPESVDGHDVDYRSQLGPEEMAIVYNTARRSGGALVSTSRFEGMANNVLEAAACGCPIIAPNVPGMEHLRDGETALLYERKDDLVAIDDELRRLPQLRDDLSHNGRRYVVEHHRIDTRAERYAAAYDDARAAARTQHTRYSDVVARRAWAVALRARRRGRVSRSPSAGAPHPQAYAGRSASTGASR